MTEPITLAVVELGPQHQATGLTRHYYGHADGSRTPVPPPTSLRLVQHPGDEPWVYLFYCDDTGEEMTDTLHESLAEAMEQAAAEYGVQPKEWDLA